MTQLLMLPPPTVSGQYHQSYPYHRSIIGVTDRKLMNSPSAKSISSFRNKIENEKLPGDFEPGPFDVICSQGKTAKTHAGNVFFQSVIHKRAKEYANATEKRTKSQIVRTIIGTIQTKSPNGGFVKKDGESRWRVVGLEQAREKVSQSLRDTLAGHYRSSLSAKKRSRKESNLKRMIDFEEIIGTNTFVSERMTRLSETIKTRNDTSNLSNLSDSNVLDCMTDTNLCILRQLKQDLSVQQKVRAGQLPQQVENQDERKMPPPSPSYSSIDETLKMFGTDKDFVL
jgi:hypothetical protein